MKSDTKRNVAVIGGGPIGSSLAIMLAEKGYNVDIYERMKDPLLDKDR